MTRKINVAWIELIDATPEEVRGFAWREFSEGWLLFGWGTGSVFALPTHRVKNVHISVEDE